MIHHYISLIYHCFYLLINYYNCFHIYVRLLVKQQFFPIYSLLFFPLHYSNNQMIMIMMMMIMGPKE